MAELQKFREKDSAYSWLVLVSAFVANMINASFFSAPALLMVEWYTVFDRPAAVVAWVPGLLMLSKSVAGVFVGGLITRFGCRAVMISGSVCACAALLCCAFSPSFELLAVSFSLLGFCNGLMMSSPIVIVYEYFDKYKSLASGLSMCGFSLSSFIMIALYRVSIDYYGWRGAMMIMAGVALNGCVCGMIFVPNVERPKPSNKLCEPPNYSGLKNLDCILFIISYSLSNSQNIIFYLLTTSRAVSKGLSVMQGSMLISCIGIASTVTRFGVSWVSNMKCTSHIALYTASVFTLSALLVLSCIQPENIVFNSTVTAIGGGMVGISSTMVPATLVDIVGQAWLATALGVGNAVQIFSTLTLPAAGFVYDQTGDFNYSFYLGAAFGVVGGCFGLIVFIRTCIHKSRPDKLEELPKKEVDQSAVQALYMDDMGSQVLYGSKPSIAPSKELA